MTETIETMTDLKQALSDAEKAEDELARKSALAARAPELRKKFQQAQRQGNARADRDLAMSRAKDAVAQADQLQRDIPALVKAAAAAAQAAYTQLVKIRQARDKAAQAMQDVNYADYLHDIETNRQTIGKDKNLSEADLAVITAAEHSPGKVKQLLEEISPDFDWLRGVPQDDIIQKDMGNFLLSKAVPVNYVMSGVYHNGY